MSWKLIYTKEAIKDAKKLQSAGLKEKAKILLDVLKENPYKNPPQYKKLSGNLSRAYSRRINIQHRLVYEVLEEVKTIKVLRMWSHYGE